MIDLEGTWLPQIKAHAALVADGEVLRAAWLEADRTRTSVINLGELLEQVFGDSDGEAMLIRAKQELEDQSLVAPIDAFLKALLAVEGRFDSSAASAAVLDSPEWADAVAAAAQLCDHER